MTLDRAGLGLSVLVSGLAVGCSDPAAAPDGWTLHRNLIEVGRLEVEVAPDLRDPALVQAVERLRAGGDFEVELVDPGQARRRGVRVLIGDAGTPGMAPVLERLGVELRRGSFTFAGRTYRDRDDALVATLADPERPGLPLTLYFGNQARGVVRSVTDLTPTWRASFRTWRAGAPERHGRLTSAGQVLAQTVVDTLEERRRAFGKEQLVTFRGFELIVPAGFEVSSRRPYVAALRRARATVIEVLRNNVGRDSVPDPVLRVYTHPVDMARLTGSWDLSSLNPVTRELQCLLAPDLPDDGGFGLARLLALELAGLPRDGWLLDGLAAHASSTWWGVPMDEWQASLAQGGVVPPLAELLSPRPASSPHCVVPLRGALLAFLLEERGRARVVEQWLGRIPPLEATPELQQGFSDWLERLHLERSERLVELHGERTAVRLRTHFRRGANLCAPLDQGPAETLGFGTRACAESLGRLRELGANSVALNFMVYDQADLPTFTGGAGPWSQASAPDLALAATAAQARALGLGLMFRPQVLTSSSGTWSAWNAAQSEELHRDFFEEFSRHLVHYALLAELCGAESFSLGSELALMAQTQNLARPRPSYTGDTLERWRALIARVRGAFRGGLLYVANSHGELSGVEFWPELDYVGLAAFTSLARPIGSRERPETWQVTLRLRDSLRQLTREAAAESRPALLVGVGFAPTAEAWRQPRDTLGEFDPGEQARLYEALEAALEDLPRGTEGLAGMWIWNWSTDPAAGRRAAPTFTPQDRPAEQVLQRIFGLP